MARSEFVGAFVARAALVRFGARDRDAYAGRWTAPDPTLFAGGKANLYVYGGVVATYDEQDRLRTYGTRSHTYNAHGQLTSMTDSVASSTTLYKYDELDNLLEVELPDGTVIEYIIDGMNRRVGRRVNGVFDRGWIYLGGYEPVAEVNASGQVTATFVYGSQAHVPDFLVRDGIAYRVLTDHIGSVRRVVRVSDGWIAQDIEYDA